MKQRAKILMIWIPLLIQIKRDQKRNILKELNLWNYKMITQNYFNLLEINQCFKLLLTIKIIIINLSKLVNLFLILMNKKISQGNRKETKNKLYKEVKYKQ